MRNLLLIAVLLLPSNFFRAQHSLQANKGHVCFQSILQAGVLLGESESEFEVKTINGIKWKCFEVE